MSGQQECNQYDCNIQNYKRMFSRLAESENHLGSQGHFDDTTNFEQPYEYAELEQFVDTNLIFSLEDVHAIQYRFDEEREELVPIEENAEKHLGVTTIPYSKQHKHQMSANVASFGEQIPMTIEVPWSDQNFEIIHIAENKHQRDLTTVTTESGSKSAHFKYKKKKRIPNNSKRLVKLGIMKPPRYMTTLHKKMNETHKTFSSKTNKGQFSCYFCKRWFSTFNLLTFHVYSHTRERPFGCWKCSRSFMRLLYLKRHVAIAHNGKKYQKCLVENCKFKYLWLGDLNMHTASVHDKKTTVKCDICAKTYPSQGNLNKHVKSEHMELESYRCTTAGCNETYISISSLNYHIKKKHINQIDMSQQQGPNQYKCVHVNCKRTFPTLAALDHHIGFEEHFVDSVELKKL